LYFRRSDIPLFPEKLAIRNFPTISEIHEGLALVNTKYI